MNVATRKRPDCSESPSSGSLKTVNCLSPPFEVRVSCVERSASDSLLLSRVPAHSGIVSLNFWAAPNEVACQTLASLSRKRQPPSKAGDWNVIGSVTGKFVPLLPNEKERSVDGLDDDRQVDSRMRCGTSPGGRRPPRSSLSELSPDGRQCARSARERSRGLSRFPLSAEFQIAKPSDGRLPAVDVGGPVKTRRGGVVGKSAQLKACCLSDGTSKLRDDKPNAGRRSARIDVAIQTCSSSFCEPRPEKTSRQYNAQVRGRRSGDGTFDKRRGEFVDKATQVRLGQVTNVNKAYGRRTFAAAVPRDTSTERRNMCGRVDEKQVRVSATSARIEF